MFRVETRNITLTPKGNSSRCTADSATCSRNYGSAECYRSM